MDILIFAAMSVAILYLMYDNRRLEKLSHEVMKKAIQEQIRKEILETMVFGKTLEEDSFYDDYEDELEEE